MSIGATQQINLDDLVYQFYDHRSTSLSRKLLRLVPANSKKLSDLGPAFFADDQLAISFDALLRFYELVCVGVVLEYLPRHPNSSFVRTAVDNLQHGLTQKYRRERRNSLAVDFLPAILKPRSILNIPDMPVVRDGTRAMVELVGLVSRTRDDDDFQSLKMVLQNTEGIGNRVSDLRDALSSPVNCSTALLG